MSPARHRAAPALALALALVAGACAGPEEPLDVAVRDFSTDVVFGGEKEEAPATFLPPDALPAPAVAALALPRAIPALTPPTTAPPLVVVECPKADPLAAPRAEATNTVTAAPAEATYVYRNVGSFEVSGPNARKGVLPPESVREVQKVVVGADKTFTHEVRSTFGDTVTTTRYRTVPLGNGRSSGGIFIASVVTKTGNDPAETFDPEPDLELLRFPVVNGTNWQSAGADPRAGIVMAFDATVDVKRRVDACGSVLDAQVVKLDGNVAPCATATPPAPPAGTPVEPQQPVTQCPPDRGGLSRSTRGGSEFRATYVIGTQYGGLTLQEETVVDAVDGGVGVHRENVATISREPEVRAG